MAANELIHSFFFSLFKSLRRKITLKGGHGGKAAGGAEPGDFGSVVVCLRRRSVQTLLVAGALAAFGIYSPLVYLVRHQDCHEELTNLKPPLLIWDISESNHISAKSRTLPSPCSSPAFPYSVSPSDVLFER